MKLDTGTKLPAQFQLTKEFEELFELIERTNKNLFIKKKINIRGRFVCDRLY